MRARNVGIAVGLTALALAAWWLFRPETEEEAAARLPPQPSPQSPNKTPLAITTMAPALSLVTVQPRR